MNLSIQELNPNNLKDLNQCDTVFTIEGRVALRFEDGEIHYRVIDAPRREKRYDIEERDYAAYLDNPDKTVYLAYADSQVAGQIILRVNWNNYAYIEDIAVDRQFRRQGIGEALVARGKMWAAERHLAGLMLETQDNNVAACRLYEKCGFVLGGFDQYLYRGLEKHKDESALFWYLVFDQLK